MPKKERRRRPFCLTSDSSFSPLPFLSLRFPSISLRGECQHTLKYRHLSQNDQAMVGYFAEIVKQFKQLPTYKWLAEADIVPSTTMNYTLADIQGALSKKHGGIPYIGCRGKKVRRGRKRRVEANRLPPFFSCRSLTSFLTHQSISDLTTSSTNFGTSTMCTGHSSTAR